MIRRTKCLVDLLALSLDKLFKSPLILLIDKKPNRINPINIPSNKYFKLKATAIIKIVIILNRPAETFKSNGNSRSDDV